MKVTKVYEGTDPGGTPGRAFIASIPQETIVQEGPNLAFLKMALKGAISTAAVAVEAFAAVLSEYSFRVGGETRILGNMRDLVALMAFYYKEFPTIGENTDNTGNDFIGGVKIPVNTKSDPAKPFTHTAQRTGVTNVANETLGISAYWRDQLGDKKPIHAVKIDYVTPATTGYDTLSNRIAPEGKLIGLIVKVANDFADGNIDISVQRLRILEDGKLHSQFNMLTDFTPVVPIDYVTPTPLADLLRDYKILDLRDEGIDAKAKELTIQIDNQDASDAISIIPVIEIQ